MTPIVHMHSGCAGRASPNSDVIVSWWERMCDGLRTLHPGNRNESRVTCPLCLSELRGPQSKGAS